MATITHDEFVNYATQWVQQRQAQIQYNWPVKGGWEGWAQVDLTAYILSLNSTFDILREQRIYTAPRKKTDLLLNGDLGPVAQIPVEIKTESAENVAGFLPGVIKDLNKLDGQRRPAYQNSTCVSMALAFSPESVALVQNIQRGGQKIFVNCYQSSEVALLLATWTATTGWVPAE